MKDTYLIGDTHGDLEAFNLLFKIYDPYDAFVIELGDFGFIWGNDTNYNLNVLQGRFAKRNCILLFIDGNHENFDLLERYPIISWNGGWVRKLRENIYHLMRGQVFTINGKKFFTMGGGYSIDKESRRRGITWWPQEDIGFLDMEAANHNLAANNDTVDYVLTHSAPMEIKNMMGFKLEYDSHNEKQLQHIASILTFDRWYFGHYHDDKDYGKFVLVYNQIHKL
jgi:hypothetical protein